MRDGEGGRRENESLFGSGVQPEIIVATQDSISLSSEGSGGWSPGHNRLQYLSSWEIEKKLFTKNILKIHLRNKLPHRCVLPCHSFVASEAKEKADPLLTAPQRVGTPLDTGVFAWKDWLIRGSVERWLLEEAARLSWP